jgi:hypothetical protein
LTHRELFWLEVAHLEAQRNADLRLAWRTFYQVISNPFLKGGHGITMSGLYAELQPEDVERHGRRRLSLDEVRRERAEAYENEKAQNLAREFFGADFAPLEEAELPPEKS